MTIMRAILLVVLFVVYASINVQVARAQPSQASFLNIDCGSDTGFVDAVTTLQWQPDTNFISSGFTASVPSSSSASNEFETFRYFNDSRPKNCYALPVTHNTSYTLRAAFFYGDSTDVLGAVPPSFQVSVDATIVANVTMDRTTFSYREFTYQSRGNATFLCLLRGPSNETPFISAISLRPAVMHRSFDGYLADRKIVRTRARWNFGGTDLVRFPTDYNDRYWSPIGPNTTSLRNSTAPLQVISTTHKINLTLYRNLVPEIVLQTALTVQGNLTITNLVYSPVSHLIFHFAELDNHTSPVSRKYMVKVPAVTPDSYVNPFNFSREHYKPYYWYFTGVPLNGIDDQITFYPKPRSRLGPLVNAMELFTVLDVAAYTTFDQDAQAIEAMKVSLGLSEWTGDPCLPVQHPWLSCGLPSPTTLQPRIEQVNLSGYKLQGPIPASSIALLDITSLSFDNNAFTGTFPNLTSMTNLAKLHLHNNRLSGSLPDYLATMESLTELSIQNNNFSGIIPRQLLAKLSNFTYRPGNPLLLESNSSLNGTIVSNTGSKSVGFSVYVFVTVTILTSLYMY